MSNNGFWDDDKAAMLEELWSKGYSASVIADHFGNKITRNAVLGKVHRMRLPMRGWSHNGKRHGSVANRRPDSPHLKPKRPSRPDRRLNGHRSPVAGKLPQTLTTTLLGFKSASPVKFEDLEQHHCRWVEDQQTGTSLHCGHPVVPGTSWCPVHTAIVFRQPQVFTHKLPARTGAKEPQEA